MHREERRTVFLGSIFKRQRTQLKSLSRAPRSRASSATFPLCRCPDILTPAALLLGADDTSSSTGEHRV